MVVKSVPLSSPLRPAKAASCSEPKGSHLTRSELPRECVEPQAAVKASEWLAKNMDALSSSNDFVEQHGVPLLKYRPIGLRSDSSGTAE